MSQSPLRPKVYTEYFNIMFATGTKEKLMKIATSKGYASADGKNKQPRTGMTRLIREIIEDYLTNHKSVV